MTILKTFTNTIATVNLIQTSKYSFSISDTRGGVIKAGSKAKAERMFADQVDSALRNEGTLRNV